MNAKENIKNLKVFSFGRNFTFKGAIKNGLDSSRFINLIVCFDSPEEFRMVGYPCPPNLFHLHKISISEAYGILINEFNFSHEKAKLKIKKWLDEFQIKLIDPQELEEYENLVRSTNNEIVREKGENYRIGWQDIKIIASFIKEGINIVHVKDKGFEETCKRHNIEIIPTPKRDLKKERELKKRLNKN